MERNGDIRLKRNAEGHGERRRQKEKVKERYSDVDNGTDGDAGDMAKFGSERKRERTEIGSERRRREERRKKEYNARAREDLGDKQWTVLSQQSYELRRY